MNGPQPSLETSFTQLFKQPIANLTIDRIEIPLIQRDYAQGRPGDAVESIRKNFLDALCTAVMSDGAAISLDFVYGNVENGALYPLDGQQRLTTLFLLHWYLAWRASVPIQNQPWTKFTYATRPGARLFCEHLVKYQPSAGEIVDAKMLSHWLTDQDWYLYPWQHDPSIQSMLVMLDALHERFCVMSIQDCTAAWDRLTDPQLPSIGFHLLPMTANSRLTDDLYIKMNSRGKPLTAFENFKANFEEVLKTAHPEEKANEFSRKIDTKWADTLWHYRGDDNLIDDEFMRYFRFVTEVCAWQSGYSFSDKSRTTDLSEQIYGVGNIKAADHLKFLFRAFDVWRPKYIKAKFESLFTAIPCGSSTQLILFNVFNNAPKDESPVDLFAACCRLYGKSAWSMAYTLLLYAVLLNRIHNTTDFPRQLRILRNLIEASSDEIRRENMPKLLADVKRIVVSNTLHGVIAFNQAQVANENDKAALLNSYPTLQTALYQLEDHKLLHGCLVVFDLQLVSASKFTQRAAAFQSLFDNLGPELSGALLAIGDYSRRQQPRWTGYCFADFGVSKNNETPWRELFKGKSGETLHPASKALMSLLDLFAKKNAHTNRLKAIQRKFLSDFVKQKKAMDWRYYFVKYPVMRSGASGRYAINPSGYKVCMLDKSVMRSNYRDPYLLAIWRESGINKERLAEPWPLFYGYETEPREMILKNSGIRIQCVDKGWQIMNVPTDPIQKSAFDGVFSAHGINYINSSFSCLITQNKGNDTIDRVVLVAGLLRDLVNAGL